MGKSVSHHCVLTGCQTLTELVVCVWGIVVAGFREEHGKRQGSDRVGASMVKAGSSSKPASVRLPVWTGCIFPSCGCGVSMSCFWFWARRFQAWLSPWCEWQWRAAGLHAMGCAFSLPEDRRDAAERSVKVFNLLLLLRLKKGHLVLWCLKWLQRFATSYGLILLCGLMAQITFWSVSVVVGAELVSIELILFPNLLYTQFQYFAEMAS